MSNPTIYAAINSDGAATGAKKFNAAIEGMIGRSKQLAIIRLTQRRYSTKFRARATTGDDMKLIETRITATAIHMRYADNVDTAKATQWLDFQVPVDQLRLPTSSTSDFPLGDPEPRLLLEIRLAALRHARDAIGVETQRISKLRDHTS